MSVASPVIDHIDPTVSPRLIYLKAGVTEYHPVDDIYKEIRTLRRLDESLRGHDVFVTAGGNVKKLADGSKRTPRYAVFVNTKVVPQDVSHNLTITGEQLYSPGPGQEPEGVGAACMDKSPLSPGVDVNIDYAPAEAEVIVVGGSDPWQSVLEAGITTAEALRLVLAAVAGKGGPTGGGEYRYRNAADTIDRIIATVDGQGGRTSVTLDGS